MLLSLLFCLWKSLFKCIFEPNCGTSCHILFTSCHIPPSRLDLGLLRQQWNTLRRLVVFLFHWLCFASVPLLKSTSKFVGKMWQKWQVRQLHREFLRAGSDVMQVTKDYRQSKSGKMEINILPKDAVSVQERCIGKYILTWGISRKVLILWCNIVTL